MPDIIKKASKCLMFLKTIFKFLRKLIGYKFEKEHYFIEFLKIMYDAGDRGLSEEEIRNSMISKGYFSKDEMDFGWMEGGIFYRYSHNPNTYVMYICTDSLKKYYVLTPEYIIKHLEYIQLQDARQSSKKATCIAFTSIAISIVLGLISIWASFQPVEVKSISDKLYNQIYYSIREVVTYVKPEGK